jgi:hypothetical protein
MELGDDKLSSNSSQSADLNNILKRFDDVMRVQTETLKYVKQLDFKIVELEKIVQSSSTRISSDDKSQIKTINNNESQGMKQIHSPMRKIPTHL